MKNAIIYTRNGNSNLDNINVQYEVLKTYANDKNYKVIEKFSDNGYSGTSTNRPDFNEMIEYINQNYENIDILLVFNIDRISRNTSDLFDFFEILVKRKIKLELLL